MLSASIVSSPLVKPQALNERVLVMTTSRTTLSQRWQVSYQKEVYQENKTNERELEKLKGDFENPLNDMNKRIRMDLKTHNIIKLTT